jgi:prevent-host-death family protein
MSPLDFKTISELKQNAKQILEDVQKTGNQVAITVNGHPVAVIVPMPKRGFSMHLEDVSKAAQEKVTKGRTR